MRGSREISLVPSLHRPSTDALICRSFLCLMYDKQNNKEVEMGFHSCQGDSPRSLINAHTPWQPPVSPAEPASKLNRFST